MASRPESQKASCTYSNWRSLSKTAKGIHAVRSGIMKYNLQHMAA